MLELRLRSGAIATFDGRIIEIFAPSGACERLHVVQVEAVVRVDAEGASAVAFVGGRVAQLRFAREEAPARARLLAAIAEAKKSYADLDLLAPHDRV